MLKYNIMITDNETGKILECSDFSCLIGSYGNSQGASEMAVYSCGLLDIVATVTAALQAIEKVCSENNEVAMLTKYFMKKGGLFDE